MDPLSVQLHSRRQIFSLARGDAFKNPFLRWLLTKWKLIPIYRISEGVANLKKNEDTFLASCAVLTNGNPLVIYPEGSCIQERRLRKLKKGAARIVFGVEEQANFNANLIVLPLGLIYSDPKKFRSNLFINFGEPIIAAKYAELYKHDKPRALNELTAAIEVAMKALVINIEHKENDQFVEELYLVYKKQLSLDLKLDPTNLEHDFKVCCDIANAVNYYQTNEPQLISNAKEKLSDYIESLNIPNLNDWLLTAKNLKSINALRVGIDALLLIIVLPFFLVGFITNYPPYKLGCQTADKLAKEVEFHASINMTIGWFAWIVYYLLQLVIIGLAFRSWLVVGIYALLVPISGFYVLQVEPLLQKANDRRRMLRFKTRNENQFNQLIRDRVGLIALFDKAKNNYCAMLARRKD